MPSVAQLEPIDTSSALLRGHTSRRSRSPPSNAPKPHAGNQTLRGGGPGVRGAHATSHSPRLKRAALESKAAEVTAQNAEFGEGFGWAQQGLNLRLRPCEGRTLPLSYAPETREAGLIARFDATCNGRKCFRQNGRPRYEARVWNLQPHPTPPAPRAPPTPPSLPAPPGAAAQGRRLPAPTPAPRYRPARVRRTRRVAAIG